jgi:16S rRNA (cytosine967-C5)-methyltransferase
LDRRNSKKRPDRGRTARAGTRQRAKPVPAPALAAPPFAGTKHTARTLALQVLLDLAHHDAFIQEILDRRLSESDLSAADRRLCTQLAYGVVRRRSTLDALLRPAVTREPHQVEAWLWDILRLGAFQLALLSHIPAHAALHETVELAEQFDRSRAKGFINAVLRSVSRLLTHETGNQPGADMLPVEAGAYRKLAQGLLPNPAESPVEYVSAAFALPGWLVERWSKRLEQSELLRLGFWFAAPAPLWLRVNTLRTEREGFLQALRSAGIEAEPGEHPQSVRLVDSAAIRDLPGYAEGWFTVQDLSAMKVASALSPLPGSRALDLCAAPGGKTTHLAELMKNDGRIIACDADPGRLQMVSTLSRRLGSTMIECRPSPVADARKAVVGRSGPLGEFDAALVDVPCSNTGVLGRRPEARWRLAPRDLDRLVPLQTKLLIEAAERVRPGGSLVYSTCSIEPEENHGVVRNFLKALRMWELEAEEEQVPGRPADGGYWARLRRKA